jgi:transposase
MVPQGASAEAGSAAANVQEADADGRDRLRQFSAPRPRARVLMEASTISEWVARLLEELGHEVVAADPN